MTFATGKFSPELEHEWETFVSDSNNGTLFHLRKFLNYHPDNRFPDASIIFKKNGRLAAVMPSTIHVVENEPVFYSHPGASYGGLVLSKNVGLKDTFEIVRQLKEHAKNRDCSKILMTIPPPYYYSKYNSCLDFALLKSGFKYKIRELSSVLELDSDPDKLHFNFADSVKRAIRKAEKNELDVSLSVDIKTYYSILKENLEMRHNVRPTHSLAELEWLFSNFPDKIKLYATDYHGEMVGGIVTFNCNSKVNLAFYIAHKHDFQSYRPVDYTIWKVICDSIKQGFLYLDFGTFTLKEEANWGLCRFKEKFGARGVFRDTLEYKF